MKKWYNMQADAGGQSARLDIYDEIGGWGVNAGAFATDLKGLGAVGTLDIHIHSPGGSIVDGAAIYAMLKSHAARKVVTIDGMALSMASVIAMAGDEIIMPKTALMMVHNPWTVTMGDADQLRKDADLLDKMRAQIVGAYVSRTGKTEAEIGAMLDAETWMDGAEAVAAGFADRLADWELKAAAKVDLSAFGKVDPRALAMQPKEGGDDGDTGSGTDTASGAGDAGNDDAAKDEAKLAAEYARGKRDAAQDIERILEEGKTGLMQRDATIKAVGVELATVKADRDRLAAELVTARADIERVSGQYADAQRKHAAALSGLAYMPEPTWSDALKKCGNDYVKARREYPAAYAAFMTASRK